MSNHPLSKIDSLLGERNVSSFMEQTGSERICYLLTSTLYLSLKNTRVLMKTYTLEASEKYIYIN